LSEVPAPKSARKASTKKAAVSTGEEKTYIGNMETSARVQEVIAQINKHTSSKPLVAKAIWGKSQYPNRIARVAAKKGLVAMEDREDVGRVYFKK